jgi:hypothetical protein
MLVAAFATTRPHMRNWMIFLGWFGGLFPDLPMFLMVGASKMQGSVNLWRQPDGLYWSGPWQMVIDYAHSLPVWTVLALAGWLMWRRGTDGMAGAGQGLLIFSAGAWLHSISDFLVHTTDAHAHFLPFTNWRFISPVSYYQPQHFGREFSFFELVFCVFAAFWIFRTFRSWTVRSLAVLMVLPVILHTGFVAFRGFPV